MDIKKTYSYFVKENFKTTGFVYLITVAVTFLVFLFALIVGETFSVSDLADLIPNLFIVSIVSFVLSIIFNRTMDLACNQFGRSRTTAYLSNILVIVSISVVMALIFSTLDVLFYKSAYEQYLQSHNYLLKINTRFSTLYVGSDIQYISPFSYWLYNFTYYTFIEIAFSAAGIFFYSLWTRLEKFYRWIVFVVIPVICAYLIPKILISYFLNTNNPVRFFEKIIYFFGLDKGFSYHFALVFTLICIIPGLIISYFIMRKKPLYGKKK